VSEAPGDSPFRLLVEEPSTVTGMEYLRALTRNAARLLGARWAFIGRLDEDDPGTLRMLTLWADGEFAEPISFDLAGTPCERVIAGRLCHHPTDVQAHFPGDPMLGQFGVEAYSGVAICNREGPLGLLALLSDEPAGPLDDVEPLLWVAAARAALEIERMGGDAALRASERRYRSFVEQCSEGVWSIDAQGVTDFVNPQMARMLGVEPAAMLGRSMFDFMDDAARAEAERNLARRNRGVRERHSFRLKHVDGHDVWTEMATSPIVDDHGEVTGALALVTDVSEHQRLQESLQQRQKLESLGLLASGVAHDFNNLLAGILGNVDVGYMQADLSPAVRRCLDRIQSAGLQAAELTKQLLVYAGRSAYRAERLDLPDLVQEVATMLQAAVPKGVTFSIARNAEALPPIQGDRTQLVQVLMNLVTNAGDALGDSGGEVRIETGVLAPGDELLERGYVADRVEPGNHVYVRVTDDGVGMDEETRAHLFDPFFTTKDSGHGLGLAAVLGILRRHRAVIVIDSAPGAGSTFTVCFPESPVREEAASAPSTPEPLSLEGRRILIIDDDAEVRRVVTELLGAAGAQVDEAADGVLGLARVDGAAQPYDAIVLDVAMPNVDGQETLHRLRAGGCETPVILCSGHAPFTGADRSRTTSLAKPFRAADLRAAIRTALDR